MDVGKHVIILFLVFFISHSGWCLRCLTCEDCTDGRRTEVTCQMGEKCMKLDLELAGRNDLKYRFEGRHCANEEDNSFTCKALGQRLQEIVMHNRLTETHTDIVGADCIYCDDKDYCNSSTSLYPSLICFVILSLMALLA